MTRRPRLEGGTALVTGAGSGIGRATALALADAGASVVCVDIDELAAETTAAACEDRGVTSRTHACDVADRRAMEALAECVRGHVVNIASGLAYLPRATEIAYCTTKAAVLMFSRSLRADWRTCGVGVSVVCPGFVNTPILSRGRFVGPMWTPERMKLAERGFGFGHAPDVVADAVMHAIRRNRAMVAPGIEARLGWHLHRLAPLALDALTGRPPPRFLLRRGAR